MTSKNTETLIPPTEFYWLSFQIMEARNLPGTCDPFCIVTLDGEVKLKTKIKKKQKQIPKN